MSRIFRLNVIAFFATMVLLSAAVRAETECAAIINPSHVRHVTIEPKPGQSQVTPSLIQTLRIMTYNVLNFYNYVGKYVPDGPNSLRLESPEKGPRLKDPEDTSYIARIIKSEVAADVVSLQEIDGEKSIDRFSVAELDGEYEGVVVRGVDQRNIEVGNLVNKQYPFEIEYRSYKHLQWKDPADNFESHPVFSRDALTAIFRIKGQKKPFLVMINIHSKSKRDRPGDEQSTMKRTAQHEAVVQIYRSLQQQFGRNVPTMILGDTNTDVIAAPELEPIKNAGFTDVLEIMDVPLDQRITHTYHPRGEPTVAQQLDAIFLSRSLVPYLKAAGIYQYVGKDGRPLPIPKSYEERELQPSDHRPLFADIDFSALIKETLGSDTLWE